MAGTLEVWNEVEIFLMYVVYTSLTTMYALVSLQEGAYAEYGIRTNIQRTKVGS